MFYRYILRAGESYTCEISGVALEEGDEVVAYTRDGRYSLKNEIPDCEPVEIYDSDCFASRYTQCDDCGDYFYDDNMTWVNDCEKVVCEECLGGYYYCDCCGHYFSEDETYRDDYGNCICAECFGDHYEECGHCGHIVRRYDGIEFNDNCDCWLCDDCWEDDGDLHDYGHKPIPIFHKADSEYESPSDPLLYMGVELEVDDGYDVCCVRDNYSEEDVYCKEDGSLSSDGFEIVSHPRTLASHKSYSWENVMRTCLSEGYTSHNAESCGLHVHVNRNFFGSHEASELNAAKLIILTSKFWDSFMLPFSRRIASQIHWTRNPASAITDSIIPDDTIEDIRNKLSPMHCDRYYAINITNRNTIEFRLFRGTLKYSTFMATLEFVNGICHWVKNHTLAEVCAVDMHTLFTADEFKDTAYFYPYLEARHITI